MVTDHKKLDNIIRETLGRRGHCTLRNMFDTAIENKNNGSDLAYSIRRTFSNYHQQPRIHRLTPFGMSVNLRKLRENAETRCNWMDRALVQNYGWKKESEDEKITFYRKYPFVDILLAFQTMGRGAYIMDIADQATMHPRQITKSFNILKLEKGFRIPQLEGTKDNFVNPFLVGQTLIRASNKPDLAKYYCGEIEISGAVPTKRLGKIQYKNEKPAGCPIETIAVLNNVPDSWRCGVERNNKVYYTSKKGYRGVVKLATFAAREYAQIKAREEALIIIPPTAVDFEELKDSDRPDIYKSDGLSFRLEQNADIYQCSSGNEEKLNGWQDMVKKLYDARHEFIKSMYSQLNPTVYKILGDKIDYEARNGQEELDSLELEKLLDQS